MYLCLFTVFGCFFYLFFAMSLFIFDDVPRNKTSAFFSVFMYFCYMSMSAVFYYFFVMFSYFAVFYALPNPLKFFFKFCSCATLSFWLFFFLLG